MVPPRPRRRARRIRRAPHAHGDGRGPAPRHRTRGRRPPDTRRPAVRLRARLRCGTRGIPGGPPSPRSRHGRALAGDRRARGWGWVGRDHPRIRRIRGLGQRRRGARRLCASREHRGRSRRARRWCGRRHRESTRCARRVRRRRVGRPLHHRQRLQGDARRELAPSGDRGRRGRVPRGVRGGAGMTVTVRLAAPLRAAAGGNTTLDFDVVNLPQLASEIADRYPELAARVLRDGTFGRFVNVFIDGEDARFVAESDLRGKRTVEILPAMSGGAVAPLPERARRDEHEVYGSFIDETIGIVARQTRDTVSFAVGSPSREALDLVGADDLVATVIRREGAKALGYGITEGEPELRDVIASAARDRGVAADARGALVALAASHDAVVVEDDPYGALRYRGDDVPSLAALGGAEVVSIGTFSKTFLPGLRVGWVIAHSEVIARMARAKQTMDSSTGTLAQRIVLEFHRRGGADAHIGRLRELYREKQDRARLALARELAGTGITWNDPDGGFYFWVTLPQGVSARALLDVGLEEGVAFVPGDAFAIDADHRSALRFSISAPTPDRIDEGVRRLRRAFDRLA